MTREVHNDTYPAIDSAKADLRGKAVFISGASRGIGRSIALSFAKAGASHIAIGARSDLAGISEETVKAAKAVGKPEPKVLCLKLEVMDAKSVSEAAAEIEKAFGKLDVVINNAAVLGGKSLIADSDPETWWQTW